MPFFSRGQIKRPDFAYPQTVAQDAKKDLKSAMEEHDAHAALNALIRGYVADALIDPASVQNSIAETDSIAHQFTDSPLIGLFPALEAQMYLAAYQRDSWKYNRRELPLKPLPEDITEWSGDQYRAKIQELCEQSYSQPQALKNLQTKDFKDIISADSLSLAFFPTLLDFVYCNAAAAISQAGIDKDFVTTALSCTDLSQGSQVYWTAQQATYAADPLEALKMAYEERKTNPMASLFLVEYSEHNDEDNIGTSRWLCDAIEGCLRLCPNNILASQLLNIRGALVRPEVKIVANRYCQPGHEMTFKVNNRSAQKAEIRVYYISDKIVKRERDFSALSLKMRAPIEKFVVESQEKAPFQSDTIRAFTPRKAGTYLIIPVLADSLVTDYPSYTYAVPAYPVTFTRCDNSYIGVLEPATGKPVAGVKVSLTEDNGKKVKYIGKTDKKGLLEATKYLKGQSWRGVDVHLTINKVDYDLDVSAYGAMESTNSPYRHVSVLTDRSIYHPGDKIQAVAVAYVSQSDPKGISTSHVLESFPLTAVLMDANDQEVSTCNGMTDEYGRYSFDFDAPLTGLTGKFSIRITGEDLSGITRLTVSDYRMPDFEIKDLTSVRMADALDTVRVKGRAVSYSGFPMVGAKVEVLVDKATWFRWFMPTDETVYSASVETDAEGWFHVEVPMEALEDEAWSYFMAKVSATSSTGTSAQASAPFSIGKQYSIEISTGEAAVDGTQPFKPSVKAYDIEGGEVEIAMDWQLCHNDDILLKGEVGASINLTGIEPGEYTLKVMSQNVNLADTASCDFTIYNTSTDVVPGNNPVWVLQNSCALPASGKAAIDILMGCKNPDTYYYLVLADYNQIFRLTPQQQGKGYSHLEIEVPAEYSNGSLYIVGVKDCQEFRQSISLTRKVDTKLTLTGESMRDKLVPASEETWTLKVLNPDGTPVQAAIVLDMYNKALEAIEPHSISLGQGYSQASYSQLRIDMPYNYTYVNMVEGRNAIGGFGTLKFPEFYFYGEYMRGRGYYGIMMSLRSMKKGMVADDMVVASPALMDSGANDMDMVAEECASVTESENSMDNATGDNANKQPSEDKFDYRDSEVPLAVWAPALTTDEDGSLQYVFQVPNANTTWQLQALAWTKELNVGKLIREFVANKPVMVQTNVPRYLRAGDKAYVTATVMNNSEEAIQAQSTIEFFNPVTGEVISTQGFTDSIAPMGKADIGAWVEAMDQAAIGYRIKTSNGVFTDGEQGAISVLSAQTSLIETTPFYLNPGETEWGMTLPKGNDARLSLTFSENPAWTIVSALPGLRQDAGSTANSAAAAIYAACVAKGIMEANPNIAKAIQEWLANPNDSALISSLEKNEDLKIALLNCTPWVQAAQSDTERMANLALIFDEKAIKTSVETAIEKLQKLQLPDGGWSWCEWYSESSTWVTGNVLAMLGDLKQLGWLPEDAKLQSMIEEAVKFWDNSWAEKWDGKHQPTDILYTIERPLFPEIEVGTYGKKVIDNTIASISANWKSYKDPAYKAMAAQALYVNGKETQAHQLMSSIDQFGKWTKNQGLKFPSVNALCDYAILLEAYAMIEPENRAVDGLRQQLIVRKQGADWGTAVVTMEVVKSILSSGAVWTVPAQGAKIICGTAEVASDEPIDKYIGNLRANISAYAGEHLKIATSGAGPAYGAVYAQFKQAAQEVKAVKCDDLSIEKTLAVRQGTKWITAPETLKVGDRVKVILTIKSKRNLSYVTILDERAAALQPVEQVPGWLYSEGVGFYRENRDSFTGLYVNFMAPGTYQLTYEMNVNTAGSFTSGVASIQSQYAPELSAHSAGMVLKVSAQD